MSIRDMMSSKIFSCLSLSEHSQKFNQKNLRGKPSKKIIPLHFHKKWRNIFNICGGSILFFRTICMGIGGKMGIC